MKRTLYTYIIFLISSLSAEALPPPKKLYAVENELNHYHSQGKYHSIHLILNHDSTFVYYSVFEGGYDMSLGNYCLTNKQLTLNWDEKRTQKSIQDSVFYKVYYKYGHPDALSIINVIYVFDKDSLIMAANSIESKLTCKPNDNLFIFNKGKLQMPVHSPLSVDSASCVSPPFSFVDPTMAIWFNCSASDSVFSVATGEVTANLFVSGHNIILVRTGSFICVYNNLTAIVVAKGQKINAGDYIGKISPEKVQGEWPKDLKCGTDVPHNYTLVDSYVLEFQLWQENKRLDPAAWFRYKQQ